MPYRVHFYWGIGALLWGLTACRSHALKIETVPVMADIYIQSQYKKGAVGQHMGQSPVQINEQDLPRNNLLFVQVQKEGFQTVNLVVTSPRFIDADIDLKVNLEKSAGSAFTQYAGRLFKKYELVQKHMRANQLDAALAFIDEILLHDPSLAFFYTLKGSIFFKQKRYQRARITWQKGLLLDPGNSGVLTKLDELKKLGY